MSRWFITATDGHAHIGKLHTDHAGRFTFKTPDWLMGFTASGRVKVGRNGRLLTFRTHKAAQAYIDSQPGINHVLKSTPGFAPQPLKEAVA